MSEKALQEGIQDAIQAMTEFAAADVVINDWSLLDQSRENAPYVLIEDSDSFVSRQDSQTSTDRWDIPINLFEAFQQNAGGWKPTLDNLRDRRQAIVDKMRDAFRSPEGSTTIDVIRNDSAIIPYYDQYLTEANMPEAIPVYIYQRIILECEEY